MREKYVSGVLRAELCVDAYGACMRVVRFIQPCEALCNAAKGTAVGRFLVVEGASGPEGGKSGRDGLGWWGSASHVELILGTRIGFLTRELSTMMKRRVLCSVELGKSDQGRCNSDLLCCVISGSRALAGHIPAAIVLPLATRA